nr:MAG TPA: hypothetical protein [Caudoviricetes sp.]
MVLVSISHSESILSTVSLCSNESVSLDSYHFHGNDPYYTTRVIYQ